MALIPFCSIEPLFYLLLFQWMPHLFRACINVYMTASIFVMVELTCTCLFGGEKIIKVFRFQRQLFFLYLFSFPCHFSEISDFQDVFFWKVWAASKDSSRLKFLISKNSKKNQKIKNYFPVASKSSFSDFLWLFLCTQILTNYWFLQKISICNFQGG